MRIFVWMLALTVLVAPAARAGDPFDDARYAIGIKDNATALRLIDSGQFPIDMQNGEGYTLLHFAAGDSNLAMVEALLERGADPTIKTHELRLTPLNRAMGTMVTARLARAVAEREPGATPAKSRPATGTGDFDKIRYAIGTRNEDQARAELDKGIDINMQTSEGFTLLHYAANDGNLAMVDELLRRGANPNIRNYDPGVTPLDQATGTMVADRIRKAGGISGRASAAARATPAAAAARPATKPTAKPVTDSKDDTAKSPHYKMCTARHYSSSALCSDTTCKMREYRKWQTCLKTGSYY